MSAVPVRFDLDLGDGHWLRWTSWMPDRTIPANAERYKGTPDIPRCGGIISHLKRDGTLCEGSIWWDLAEVRQLFVDHDYWTVQCWDPLTCNPSFLCHCGDHGFIRDGKWVRA